MKRTATFAALLLLVCLLLLPTANAAAIVISNDNENTNLEFRSPGLVYVEFIQFGSTYPIDTEGGFVTTTVTAEDADGNVLGEVHAVDGVLDYSAYLGTAVRLHLVNSYTDEYIYLNTSTAPPAADPGDDSVPPAPVPSKPAIKLNGLQIFGIVMFVIMLSIITTATVSFAKERKKS